MTKPSLIASSLLALSSLLPLMAADQPNIPFVIADDASRHFGQSYDCDWVKTPTIDRVGREGLIFDNVDVPTAFD